MLYASSYPPNEFPTSSIIEDELTPTPIASTLFDQQHPSATISTDEEDENHSVEQPNSPTHTTSSNGHDTVRSFLLRRRRKKTTCCLFLQHSKDSSDDGKQTSCASSDIEVISSPSVTSGLALSTTETYDKCRELRDARRPVVREVLVRFPSHPTNLKYHHHPLPMDNIDKNIGSNFDAPSWSSLIDEAATEQNHYQTVRVVNDRIARTFSFSLVDRRS